MGYSSLLMGRGFDQPRNSVNQIINYLEKHPFKTESEIQENVFGYFRNRKGELESNKKYADMLRRGLSKGLIKRVKVEGKRFKYIYYV